MKIEKKIIAENLEVSEHARRRGVKGNKKESNQEMTLYFLFPSE